MLGIQATCDTVNVLQATQINVCVPVPGSYLMKMEASCTPVSDNDSCPMSGGLIFLIVILSLLGSLLTGAGAYIFYQKKQGKDVKLPMVNVGAVKAKLSRPAATATTKV